MRERIRVGIFGGKSAEHEVSIQSTTNILAGMDKDKYDPLLIYIDQQGHWSLPSNIQLLDMPSSQVGSITLLPQGKGELLAANTTLLLPKIDVAFPVLHGPFGEDGTVQGLLKLANVPFVGASILGSAVGMDKDVMKRLLRESGIPVCKFVAVYKNDPIEFTSLARALGTPLFIKPANLGSSIGVHKATDAEELKTALADAFSYDTKVLIEEFVNGREIECGILGNTNPQASLCGEAISNTTYFSYDAKYGSTSKAETIIPAAISKEQEATIQQLALNTFKTLNCQGLARVDCFLKMNGEILVNEINTLPGFTSMSMYPKLWAASGVPLPALIDKLINLALERFGIEQKLKTSRAE